MIQDTINPIMVRLIIATGVLLLFSWGAGIEPEGMKQIGQMRNANVQNHSEEIGGRGMIEADVRSINGDPFNGVLTDGR